MTINISLPEEGSNLRPRLTVIGVGGAGGNAVNNMINSNLEGVDFLVTNTDAQALENSVCKQRVQLGLNSTKGLGAGMRPEIGKTAAEESAEDIQSKLGGTNMAFIAAGMGGGTGTGAAPVIAKIAREHGILTVGVVTKPFHFEGIQRMKLAEEGVKQLEQYVDTLIIIPNQNLFRIANEKTTFSDAFKMADDVLYAGVRGVTDLMVMPGLINLDFSDVKTVMSEMGKAMMGTGEAQGENRAVAAAEAAIANPLIDDVSLKGAKGLIINITGGKDLTLYEVDEAANRIREEVDVDANIIFGSTCDSRLEGVMRVSIVATGIELKSEINPSNFQKSEIKIDNSVYQKQTPQVLNAFSNPISLEKTENKLNGEGYNHSELKEDENIDSSKNQLSSNNEEDQSISVINGDLSEEETIEVEEYQNNQNGHEETSHSSSENQVENISLSEETPGTADHDESQVRRISLFDHVETSNSEKFSEAEDKKEPVISFMENQNVDNLVNHDIDSNYGESADSLDVNQEKNDAAEDIDDNINQEEELLDIPTFLRRQAN
ncbi:MAG: Cell division protein FtsZ [Alphaproteobacteria bacterium MarineAlpha5_Bin11]|nr:cell division protein FtsZ [Pelagibacteraceae bacterium]PPR43892.1 MAG: Cell division protein FtsZ [Alphaproteobacteria bacterium MarineAlpha5_Bin11]PPR51631.1 MAG: Cell division protein FtsZ [Alphaproteobacteria bacterium MarineAlpha5_Bin10]|tara:strand:- start:8715 stop:10358 length:1644 start_codon:yes stop_codon:yes gene_type:complete